MMLIANDLKTQIIQAIKTAQTEIRWKPGKARKHLNKRIRLGHLPPDVTAYIYLGQLKEF